MQTLIHQNKNFLLLCGSWEVSRPRNLYFLQWRSWVVFVLLCFAFYSYRLLFTMFVAKTGFWLRNYTSCVEVDSGVPAWIERKKQLVVPGSRRSRLSWLKIKLQWTTWNRSWVKWLVQWTEWRTWWNRLFVQRSVPLDAIIAEKMVTQQKFADLWGIL